MRARPPQLGLFGELSWRHHGEDHRLSAGRAASVVALLAEHQPAAMAGTAVLDRLWQEPPRSGTNAVQRHVCAVRRSLRAGGLSPDVIETLPNGYRLHPEVRTDLTLLDELLEGPASEIPCPLEQSSGVRWWLEPLAGLPWEPHVGLQRALARRAVDIALRWSEWTLERGRADRVAEVLGRMVAVHPDDERLTCAYLEAAISSGESTLVTAAASTGTASHVGEVAEGVAAPVTVLPPSPVQIPSSPSQLPSSPAGDLAALQPTVARWVTGDADGAFEALEQATDRLPDDVQRRIGRAMVWTYPDDGHARLLWRHLPGVAAVLPHQAERTLLSLDAYALEQMVDGLEVADREVDGSETLGELVRSLRVRFVVGLGHPVDAAQVETVDRLSTIDDRSAQVESRRFQVILAIKQARFGEAVRALEAYDAVRTGLGDGTPDDVTALALRVLADHPDLPLPGPNTTTDPTLPLLVHQATVDASALWHHLVRGNPPQDPSAIRQFHTVRDTAPGRYRQALDVLRTLRLEGVDAVREQVADLAEIRPVGGRDVHAPLAALAEVALATHGRELARRAFDLLEPWSGEVLGVWPLDAVFGPTDALLTDLANLAS